MKFSLSLKITRNRSGVSPPLPAMGLICTHCSTGWSTPLPVSGSKMALEANILACLLAYEWPTQVDQPQRAFRNSLGRVSHVVAVSSRWRCSRCGELELICGKNASNARTRERDAHVMRPIKRHCQEWSSCRVSVTGGMEASIEQQLLQTAPTWPTKIWPPRPLKMMPSSRARFQMTPLPNKAPLWVYVVQTVSRLSKELI